jgi:hypothetical protein
MRSRVGMALPSRKQSPTRWTLSAPSRALLSRVRDAPQRTKTGPSRWCCWTRTTRRSLQRGIRAAETSAGARECSSLGALDCGSSDRPRPAGGVVRRRGEHSVDQRGVAVLDDLGQLAFADAEDRAVGVVVRLAASSGRLPTRLYYDAVASASTKVGVALKTVRELAGQMTAQKFLDNDRLWLPDASP